MSPFFRACLVVVLLCALQAPAQVVNGGFETPDGIYPYRVFSEGRQLPGWVVERGTVEITGGRYWQAAEGSQSLDLNGIFEEVGTIYQDVPTKAGQRYRIRFAFAGNPEGGPVMKSFKVYWAGQEVTTLSFDTTGLSGTNMGWRQHELVVAAAGTTGRLKFESLTPTFCGPTLDDVSVTLVDGSTPTLRERILPASNRMVEPAPTSAGSELPGVSAAINTTATAATAAAVTNAALQIQFCPVLTIFGTVGGEYQIESADRMDSAQWQVVTNLTLASNPQLWVDLRGATTTQRYFRVVPTRR